LPAAEGWTLAQAGRMVEMLQRLADLLGGRMMAAAFTALMFTGLMCLRQSHRYYVAGLKLESDILALLTSLCAVLGMYVCAA
jgi:hypothetical protein